MKFFQEQQDLFGEVEIPILVFGPPERENAWFALGRTDLHVVMGHLLDTPDLGTQGEGIADTPFPDEFFIQFADLGF